MDLTSIFPPATAEKWRAQIKKELKLDSLQAIEWHNENGLVIAPFYSSEDQKRTYLPAFTHREWDICVDAGTKSAVEKNARLLKALQSGATAVQVVYAGESPEELLKTIQLEYIRSSFVVTLDNARTLLTYLHAQYAVELNCAIFCRELYTESAHTQWKDLQQEFPRVSLLSASVLQHHNANCFAVTELALALAALTEQLNSGIISKTAHIQMGAGNDYFVELAKFRALHRLWLQLAPLFNCNAELHIHVETTLTNKTLSDAYNNLLRTTTETLSAILGGAHSITVNGFDVLQPGDSELAFRMAINQQLILREEALLSHFADVACGSWFIENLTDALAEKALAVFNTIEQAGGYNAVIASGWVTNRIADEANQRQSKINSGERVVIGINKYKNTAESVQLSNDTVEQLKNKGIVNPSFEYELKNFFSHA
jgi:methylmalonyl-CoA mutase